MSVSPHLSLGVSSSLYLHTSTPGLTRSHTAACSLSCTNKGCFRYTLKTVQACRERFKAMQIVVAGTWRLWR